MEGSIHKQTDVTPGRPVDLGRIKCSMTKNYESGGRSFSSGQAEKGVSDATLKAPLAKVMVGYGGGHYCHLSTVVVG